MTSDTETNTQNQPPYNPYQTLYNQSISLSNTFISESFKKFKKHNEILATNLTNYDKISLPNQHTFNVYILLVHCLDFRNDDLENLLAGKIAGKVSSLKRLNFLDLPSDKMTRIKLAEIIERNFNILVKPSHLEYKIGVKRPNQVDTNTNTTRITARNNKSSAENQSAINLIKFFILLKLKNDLNLDIDSDLPENDDSLIGNSQKIDEKLKIFLKNQEENRKYKDYRLVLD